MVIEISKELTKEQFSKLIELFSRDVKIISKGENKFTFETYGIFEKFYLVGELFTLCSTGSITYINSKLIYQLNLFYFWVLAFLFGLLSLLSGYWFIVVPASLLFLSIIYLIAYFRHRHFLNDLIRMI